MPSPTTAAATGLAPSSRTGTSRSSSGGLVRSLGGWVEVRAIRQRAARGLADARSLGSGPFGERLLTAGEGRQQALIRRRCRRARIGREELELGSRRRRVAAVRSELAVHLVTRLGLSLADAA
jgi:hypothetical protein